MKIKVKEDDEKRRKEKGDNENRRKEKGDNEKRRKKEDDNEKTRQRKDDNEKQVWSLMENEWKVSEPKLIISVTGLAGDLPGEHDSILKAAENFKTGLVKAAEVAGEINEHYTEIRLNSSCKYTNRAVHI